MNTSDLDKQHKNPISQLIPTQTQEEWTCAHTIILEMVARVSLGVCTYS